MCFNEYMYVFIYDFCGIFVVEALFILVAVSSPLSTNVLGASVHHIELTAFLCPFSSVLIYDDLIKKNICIK